MKAVIIREEADSERMPQSTTSSRKRVIRDKFTVLYTTSDTSPQSGAFRHLLHMSRGITGCGYWPVLALHCDSKGAFGPMTVREGQVYFLDLPRPKRRQPISFYFRFVLKTIQSVYALVRLIRQEQVALLHINEILDIYAGVAARIAGVPCVWHVRAELSMTPRLSWVLAWLVMKLATRVIVVSESVSAYTFSGQNEGKIEVIYDPGPDYSKFHPDLDGSSVRKEFGIPNDAFLVTLVAKLSERKGHKVLLQAAPEILASHPTTYFMIVGGELEGERHEEYARELKALPFKIGVQNNVIFTGFRSDIPQIMAASDIIVHASTYADPFPGVVLQGMAVGKPVIASNLGGPTEQIENGISGILVEPNDSSALAEAICSLLSDKIARERIGTAAAIRVRAQFTDDRFSRELTAIYKRVLTSNEVS